VIGINGRNYDAEKEEWRCQNERRRVGPKELVARLDKFKTIKSQRLYFR